MPWLETNPMNERVKFVQDAWSDRFTMAEVCARVGVSRKTGYKWIARSAEDGRRGLGDRSRAPHTCPHTLSNTMTELLVTTREAHPFWGARKLLVVLQGTHPRIHAWPAPTTVADLLARRGLVQRRRMRRPTTHPGVISAVADAPNDLWKADFLRSVSHGRWQLRCVSSRVQRRTPARSTRSNHTDVALYDVTSTVSVSVATTGVSRALPREAQYHRRHLHIRQASAVPRQRAHQSTDRPRGNRRRALVDLLPLGLPSDARRTRLHHPKLTHV